jgi:YfiH family protein
MISSKLLTSITGINHFFGTGNEELPETLPVWKQNHGTRAVEVLTPQQECGECDTIWTRQPNQPVAVKTADCVPILLARRDATAVAAIHAGWRGTRARIVQEFINSLTEKGEWVAAIGPCIGPCCYEVSQELAADFRREFPNYGWSTPRTTERYLDLAAINEGQLKEVGIKEVEIIRACTFCAQKDGQPLFHSYRREGKGYRQFSVISSKRSIAN